MTTVLTTAATWAAWTAAGWFAWSLGEYVLHRFLMHELRGRGYASKEHLRHHASRDSVLESWVLSWAGIILTGSVMGWLVAPGLGVGWVSAYGFYELHHYWAHRRTPRSAYQRWLRLHHFHHHFGHPMANHGVTSPIWDHVFRTYEPVERVKVPRRMAMVWLVDEHGELRPEYADHYELAGAVRRTDEQAHADLVDAFANRAPAV